MEPKKLGRFVLEFFVIFISITFSFLVEEWRDDNANRQKASKMLSALSKELRQKTRFNEGLVWEVHLQCESARKIAASFTGERIRSDSLLLYVIQNQIFSEMDPNLRYWQSILQSGNVDLIRTDLIDSINYLLYQYEYLAKGLEMIQAMADNTFPTVLETLDIETGAYTSSFLAFNTQSRSTQVLTQWNTQKFYSNIVVADYYFSLYWLKDDLDRAYFEKLKHHEGTVIKMIEEEISRLN